MYMAQYRKSSSQQPQIHLEWNQGSRKSNKMFISKSSFSNSFISNSSISNSFIRMRTKPSILLLFLLFILLVMLLLSSNSCLDSVCPSSSLHSRTSSSLLRTSSSAVPSMSMKHVLKDGMGSPIASMSSIPYVPPFISAVGGNNKMSFDQLSNNLDLTFDMRKSDVIVFLHIQKTGGTKFGRRLVRDLILEQPCQCKKGKKRCKCVRPSINDLSSYESNDVSSPSDRFWLFSRYSMGWKCGLHADWTELTNCVDHAMDESEGLAAAPSHPLSHPSELKVGRSPSQRRRYFYITLLRDPIARFISEWKHVQRGATWKSSRHWCSGRIPSESELPSCYPGQPDWRGVSLNDFMSCDSNLAINRQTRMLADLTLVGCYNNSVMSQSERDSLMLASAKDNLRKMAYFGICENQTVSQYLFEATFKLNFKSSFVQLNQTHSTSAMANLSDNLLNRIKSVNHLDIQLYEYASKLLWLRFETMVRMDQNFDQNWKRVSSNQTEERKKEVLVEDGEWSRLRSSNDSVTSVDSAPGTGLNDPASGTGLNDPASGTGLSDPASGTVLRKQVRHDLIRKSSKIHPEFNLIPDMDEDYDQEDTPNYEGWKTN